MGGLIWGPIEGPILPLPLYPTLLLAAATEQHPSKATVTVGSGKRCSCMGLTLMSRGKRRYHASGQARRLASGVGMRPCVLRDIGGNLAGVCCS